MKQLLLVALSGLVLASCQKENSFETSTSGPGPAGAPTYYIQAKFDGTPKTFYFSDMAKVTDFGSGLKSISFVGLATSSASNVEGINLSINFFNIAPAVGTYTEDNSGTDYIAAAIYNPNSATTVYTAGLSGSSVMPLSITITKMDNTVIEGTFKGAFYKTDVNSGIATSDYITITEGSFRLPIQ
jgi:hypothetical protein